MSAVVATSEGNPGRTFALLDKKPTPNSDRVIAELRAIPPTHTAAEIHSIASARSEAVLQRAEARRARTIAFEDVRTRLGVTTWAKVARDTGIHIARLYDLVNGAEVRPAERELIEAAIARRNGDAKAPA